MAEVEMKTMDPAVTETRVVPFHGGAARRNSSGIRDHYDVFISYVTGRMKPQCGVIGRFSADFVTALTKLVSGVKLCQKSAENPPLNS